MKNKSLSKNDNEETDTDEKYNLSISEAGSNTVGSWLVTWKTLDGTETGCGLKTCLSFLISSKRKLTTKEKKLMPDLDSSTSPPGSSGSSEESHA